ncbi:hypothetical protein ACJJTC_003551 [Scirpophaga incertulas]
MCSLTRRPESPLCGGQSARAVGGGRPAIGHDPDCLCARLPVARVVFACLLARLNFFLNHNLGCGDRRDGFDLWLNAFFCSTRAQASNSRKAIDDDKTNAELLNNECSTYKIKWSSNGILPDRSQLASGVPSLA